MKRIFRITAMFLAVLVLFAFLSSCDRNKTEPVSSETAVPTAAASKPETTAPPPITTTQETQGTTEPVLPAEQYFTVRKSAQSESMLSVEGENAPLYASRAECYFNSSGMKLQETVTTDLKSSVMAGALSGDSADILLLHARTEGASLLCAGVLQDLSAPGIGLAPESDCVISTLAEDLTFDGHLYLLPYRGLLSDISSTFAVSVRNKTDAFMRIRESFTDGTYSLDVFYSYLRDWEDIDPESFEEEQDFNSEEYYGFEIPNIGGGSNALEGLLLAAGGRVMAPAETVPEVKIYSTVFLNAFSSVSGLASYLSDREEVICISTLAERETLNRTVFPLPPVSPGAAYVTPVDPDGLTVVAAMGGLVYGQRVAEFLTLFSDCSGELRSRVTEASDLSVQMAGILFSTGRLELSKLYTWGDLYDFVFAYLGSAEYDALANAPDLMQRLKAAASAAGIVRERCT